jgi:23S rRNA (guanosine2251-2'-O)-methyltransferase
MSNNVIIYGHHAAIAALNNPQRKVHRIYITERNLDKFNLDTHRSKIKVVDIKQFDSFLPENSVHQGIAVEVSTKNFVDLNTLVNEKLLIALDQLTDPQNIGAIIRSCAAFEVSGIIFPKDNAPTESGALAKAASGTLENISLCKVTNLSRSLNDLKKKGYWIVGLDGHSSTKITQFNQTDKTVFVMGAEGKGLRNLTKKSCDILVSLPISNNVESLNVSIAAAICLYEFTKKNYA